MLNLPRLYGPLEAACPTRTAAGIIRRSNSLLLLPTLPQEFTILGPTVLSCVAPTAGTG
jgi:hypothetical protein